MRDMICGGAILTWVFVAAHSGSGQVAGLFGIVSASLGQIVGHLG